MTRRRVLRISLLAALCLLLGAVTTVGVAWLLAAIDPFSRGSTDWVEHATYSTQQVWEVRRSEVGHPDEPRRHASIVRLSLQSWGGSPDPVAEIIEFEALIYPVHDRVHAWLHEAEPVAHTVLISEGVWDIRGWPCGALTCEWHWQGNSLPTVPPRPIDGIPLPASPANQPLRDRLRALPLRPMWLGFVFDTGLYAVGWATALRVSAVLRRSLLARFRVSRGMCGSCGYDLKGSNGPVCPECGKPE